ncbi:MAG: DUF4340 domain-containing protein [Acidobacteriota bacterium]|nr:DUF4340 domain-containing protein [Acidobacteriota bacterium]
MMRGIRSTLVLLVIALGLGVYIYFVETDRSPAGTPAPLESVFDFASDDIVSISVTSETGDHTVIEKNDGRWQLVEPFTGNVDVTKVVSLSSSLANLEMQRVVTEPDDAADLALFGLATPRIVVEVTTTSASDLQLLIGERTPTGSDLYATVADSNRVFLISGFLDTTFNQTTFDLRDKTILDITRDQVDSLEVTSPDHTIRLRKAENQWSLVSPIAARADLGVTDGIVGRLSTGQMVSVEAENTDNLEPYGLDQPQLIITVGLGSSAATLLIGDTAPSGSAYARDAARGLVFTVDGSLVTELEQEADEYRRRELFAFRPFNATALEFGYLGERWAFERIEAATEGESDTWRRTSPETGEVETTAMDDLLVKLSNLRAESFVSSRDGTGLDSPVATVEVTFDDHEDRERVTFGQVSDEVFAVTGDEPGAAQVNTRSWDDAIAALTPLQ